MAEPQSAYHVSAIGMAEDALRVILPAGWIVRTQAPVALDDESEPDTDPATPYGWRYRSVRVLAPRAVVDLLAIPPLEIPVADLLP